jgi:hypothetical protein
MIIGRHHRGQPQPVLVKRCVVCWLGGAEQRKTYSFLCLHLCMSTGAPHVQSQMGSWFHSCQHSTCQSSANPALRLSSKVSSHLEG